VIHRVHRHATGVWSASKPATATCLAETDVHMVNVADLADDSPAIHVNKTNFAGW
jgi:hypothetical protein